MRHHPRTRRGDRRRCRRQHAPIDAAEAGEPIPVLPNVHWLYEYGEPRRLAQTEAIRLPDTITREGLDALLRAIIDGHEVLRCRLDRDAMTLVAQPKADILSEVWVGGELAATLPSETSARGAPRPTGRPTVVGGVAARARTALVCWC